jgi:hypothetical protein
VWYPGGTYPGSAFEACTPSVRARAYAYTGGCGRGCGLRIRGRAWARGMACGRARLRSRAWAPLGAEEGALRHARSDPKPNG